MSIIRRRGSFKQRVLTKRLVKFRQKIVELQDVIVNIDDDPGTTVTPEVQEEIDGTREEEQTQL